MALRLPSEINEEEINEFKEFLLKLAYGDGENTGVVGCIFKDLPDYAQEVLVGIGDGYFSITEERGNLLTKVEENFDLYAKSSISLNILFVPELTELLRTSDETVTKFNEIEELLNDNKYIKECTIAYDGFLIELKSFNKLGKKGRANLTSANVLELQPIYIPIEPETPEENEDFDEIG